MGPIRIEEERIPGRGERDGVERREIRIIWQDDGVHFSRQESFRRGVNGPEIKGSWEVFIVNSRKMEVACPEHARICEEVLEQYRKRREEEEQD